MGIDRMAFEGGNDPSVHTTTGEIIGTERSPREGALERLLREDRKIIEGLCAGCPCYPPLGKTCHGGKKDGGCIVRTQLAAIDAALKEEENHGNV